MTIKHWANRAVAATAATALLTLAAPGVGAQTADEPATTESTLELPMMGTGLTITIEVDDAGDIQSLSYGDTSVPQDEADEIVFSAEDGTTSLKVEAEVGELEIDLELAVADVLGAHRWSSTLLGSIPASISYEIAENDDGSLSMVNVVASPEEFITSVSLDDGKVQVVFEDSDGNQRKVEIKVKASDEGAELKVEITDPSLDDENHGKDGESDDDDDESDHDESDDDDDDESDDDEDDESDHDESDDDDDDESDHDESDDDEKSENRGNRDKSDDDESDDDESDHDSDDDSGDDGSSSDSESDPPVQG